MSESTWMQQEKLHLGRRLGAGPRLGLGLGLRLGLVRRDDQVRRHLHRARVRPAARLALEGGREGRAATKRVSRGQWNQKKSLDASYVRLRPKWTKIKSSRVQLPGKYFALFHCADILAWKFGYCRDY